MNQVKLLLLLMAIMGLSGCAESSAQVKPDSGSPRTDFLQELTSGGLPHGFADLRFSATLKTHQPGIYSATDRHGTPDYQLLLSVDGQTVTLQGILQAENAAAWQPIDPEAGNGIRYRFSKRLYLKPGSHRIVVALPADGVSAEGEIVLQAGEVINLALQPIYRTTPGKRQPGINGTTFKEGLSGIRLTLNGRDI